MVARGQFKLFSSWNNFPYAHCSISAVVEAMFANKVVTKFLPTYFAAVSFFSPATKPFSGNLSTSLSEDILFLHFSDCFPGKFK